MSDSRSLYPIHNPEVLMRSLVSSLLLLLLAATFAVAQADKNSRPSPPATATVSFADGKTVTIAYSRPSVKGRKIMGELVPYGKVWRTGANEATSFVTTADLSIGGTTVPAGKYTLYSLPGENSWKLIVNKETGQWGTKYDEKQDLARIDMKVSKTSAPVEQFTISLDKTGANAATLKLEWENTSASVEIKEKK
jgi:hypothetical protein